MQVDFRPISQQITKRTSNNEIIDLHCENCVLMLLLFNNENHKSVRDNNDSDGDNDEIASNESQVGEVCTERAAEDRNTKRTITFIDIF